MPETMVNTEEETSFDIFEENDFQTDTENEDSNNEDNSDKGENKEEVNSAENKEKEAETMLPVKFLGKEYPIPEGEVKSLAERLGIKEDDVITTIQKGLNYDHAVNNTPLHKQIAKLAELNGKTPEEYSKFLEQSIGQISLRHEIDKVRKEYHELSDEAVEIIAQKNVENSELANYKAAKENEESKKKQEEQDREKELAPYRAFHEKYPDVKEFPEEVAAMIGAGTDPTFAYELYNKNQKQINELTSENTELKQKQTNYYSSMGSSKDSASGNDDNFLSGFFGE